MALKKRKWWNLIGLFFDLFKNEITEAIPDEVKLESEARGMVASLKEMSNVVELSMAMADKKYVELTKKVELYKTYDAQARSFLKSRKNTEAERCVVLKLQAAKDIESLKNDYESLQNEAEQKLANFQNKKHQVEEKIKRLPKLKNDAKMIRQQKEIDDKFSSLNLDNPSVAFDEIANDIEMKKFQQKNRQLLNSNPNAQLDISISNQLEQKSIEKEINRLHDSMNKINNAESEVLDKTESIDDAIKLLEKPRFTGGAIFSFSSPEMAKTKTTNDNENVRG